ncbi:hypothetical protein BHE90_006597 [Fusarium euwallaceae]|uniref:AB hydrolase-1 domain-containing protein n=2 Tax=Fusarium solani species complex TaxID=232080 RepID=A0A430LT47_9HYPO|nr:hypothetical protein CEP51_007615 [Fusarium floridanum]RTE78891.1 hypothetical protein BHE90_006597 [Fusarium euwallaceae]
MSLEDAATLIGDPANSSPLIICFHGSGDSCTSWIPLAELLGTKYRVLLWDRRDPYVKPESAINGMLSYLDQAKLSPPYILIGHSYGGMFVRLFLQRKHPHVAGVVLVETGQEAETGKGIEERQYKNQILGNKPLVVIRGNTLIGKWKQYEEALAAVEGKASPNLVIQKQMLDAADKEDERLKKAQLALSRCHRYVHIPDCGHDVIQQRPEAVVNEVAWVMDNLQPASEHESTGLKVVAWLRSLKKRFLG